MKRVLATAAVLAAANLSPAAGQDFYAHWGDGRAELSSYRIDQPRYGESREAYGVMIFVTEDLNAGTGIKVESQVPAADRVYVLKLNNVLKFTTGIYDYSVMTSVFSAVEPGVGTEPFELRKVNLTSQEWCGHVFEEVRVAADSLRGDLNSYFERDGRQRWNMETPAAFESEDNLLIRIRELNGEWMKTEEARQLRLLPGLWKIRSGEAPRKLVHATLTKGAVEEIETGGVRRAAVRWTWGYGPRSDGGLGRAGSPPPHTCLAGLGGQLRGAAQHPPRTLLGAAGQRRRDLPPTSSGFQNNPAVLPVPIRLPPAAPWDRLMAFTPHPDRTEPQIHGRNARPRPARGSSAGSTLPRLPTSSPPTRTTRSASASTIPGRRTGTPISASAACIPSWERSPGTR